MNHKTQSGQPQEGGRLQEGKSSLAPLLHILYWPRAEVTEASLQGPRGDELDGSCFSAPTMCQNLMGATCGQCLQVTARRTQARRCGPAVAAQRELGVYLPGFSLSSENQSWSLVGTIYRWARGGGRVGRPAGTLPSPWQGSCICLRITLAHSK